MKRFVMFAASLVLSVSMAACAVAGSSGEYPSTKIRYKMTVEVETPEGIKTGSAVREISMVSRPEMMAEGNDTHVRLEKGEAVVVDLGQRGVLFATLGSSMDDGIGAIFNAFPSNCPEGNVSRCGIRYYSSLKNDEEAFLPAKNYPTLITFKSLQDPLSVVTARDDFSCPPAQKGCENFTVSLESAFGKGVTIKEITIKVTKDELTEEIKKWLPWLETLKGKYLHGSSISRGAPLGLHSGDFTVGG